jgi:hypothetical protein
MRRGGVHAGLESETDCAGYVMALHWSGGSSPDKYPGQGGSITVDLCAVCPLCCHSIHSYAACAAAGMLFYCSLLNVVQSDSPSSTRLRTGLGFGVKVQVGARITPMSSFDRWTQSHR